MRDRHLLHLHHHVHLRLEDIRPRRINLDEYRRPHKAYFKITIDFGKQILKTKLWKNDLSDVGKFNAIGEEIEKDLAKAVWIA